MPSLGRATRIFGLGILEGNLTAEMAGALLHLDIQGHLQVVVDTDENFLRMGNLTPEIVRDLVANLPYLHERYPRHA